MENKEFQETWNKVLQLYNGYEKWKRHQAYCDFRQEGFSKEDAWQKMYGLPESKLPDVVFEWDGISHYVPELEKG